jgi:hypothetical protein
VREALREFARDEGIPYTVHLLHVRISAA